MTNPNNRSAGYPRTAEHSRVPLRVKLLGGAALALTAISLVSGIIHNRSAGSAPDSGPRTALGVPEATVAKSYELSKPIVGPDGRSMLVIGTERFGPPQGRGSILLLSRDGERTFTFVPDSYGARAATWSSAEVDGHAAVFAFIGKGTYSDNPGTNGGYLRVDTVDGSGTVREGSEAQCSVANAADNVMNPNLTYNERGRGPNPLAGYWETDDGIVVFYTYMPAGPTSGGGAGGVIDAQASAPLPKS